MIAYRVRSDLYRLHRILNENKSIIKHAGKCTTYKMSNEDLELYLKKTYKINKLN
jgi:hypothetical protein